MGTDEVETMSVELFKKLVYKKEGMRLVELWAKV